MNLGYQKNKIRSLMKKLILKRIQIKHLRKLENLILVNENFRNYQI